MRQRIDFCGFTGVVIYFANTGQRIGAPDVHRTRPAYPFPTRPPKSESRIHFVLDFYESVQNHWTASDVNRLQICFGLQIKWKSLTN